MKIEGIPEGWEFVRIGTVLKNEWYLDNGRNPVQCNFGAGSKNYVVVKQIEPPKPIYIPWTLETCPMFSIVHDKFALMDSHINTRTDKMCFIANYGWYLYDKLLASHWRCNGEPCGTKVQP